MSIFKAVFQLLYDLLIGDCWQVTLTVLLILAAGIGLLRLAVVGENVLVPLVAVSIFASAGVVIYLEAMYRHHRANGGP